MRTSQLSKQKNFIYKEIDSPNPDIQYFWELETLTNSKTDISEYKIIPDGCIDIIFEKKNNTLFNPVISAPFSTITTIDLPRNSKYMGIRFKPGKFRKYIDIDLNNINNCFIDFQRKEYKSLNDFLNSLKSEQRNPLTKFDNSIDSLLCSSLSQRQKRRIFKLSTGFTIRNFIKIMNFQRSLNAKYIDKYFDQSHKIKVYKSLVKMTPSQLEKYL